MTPEQLAKSNSEHGHQVAAMAWCNMAAMYGFKAADDNRSYNLKLWALSQYGFSDAKPALNWIHAIPNGGLRSNIQGAKLKAEGVKPGIPDLFLPVPRTGFHGCYIEIKKPGQRKSLSEEQKKFKTHAEIYGYSWVVCDHWEQVVETIKFYLS